MSRKIIKLNWIDSPLWGKPDSRGYVTNKEETLYVKAIRKNYNIEWTNKPDYLLCGHFGYEFSKYDCVKIFIPWEQIHPNLNAYDYAIVMITPYPNSKRIFNAHMCLNNIKMKESYDNIFTRDKFSYDDLLQKQGFCSQLISNSYANPMRFDFFNRFATYKQIASGGKILNNIGGPVDDKIEFIKKYKFTFAIENFRGARSEKLPEAFGAHTIPIYWGDPDIGDEYNTKAFVNFHDYGSIEKVLERVVEIDNNDALYLQMMHEPAFLHPKTYEEHFNDLANFFVSIFETPIEEAKRDKKLKCYELIEQYGRKKYYIMGKRQKLVSSIFHLFAPLKNIPIIKLIRALIIRHRKIYMNSVE